MRSDLAYYFGLPHGQVWPNLIASLICVGVAWWRLRARTILHHAEQLAQRERHHEEMKAHVTAAVAAVRPASRQAKTLAAKPAKGAGA